METKEFLPAPQNAQEAMQIAEYFSKSNLVPKIFQGRPQDCFIAMWWCHNLNIPVIQGLQGIAVINGKPSIYGDVALAIVRSSGLLEDFREEIKGDGDGRVAVCVCKRKGQASEIKASFSVQDAKTAGLWGSNVWGKYPDRMMTMRARAFALRDGFADVMMGMSIAEEQQDVVDEATGEIIKETPKMPKRKSKSAPEPVDAEIVEPVTEDAHVAEDTPVDEPEAVPELSASQLTQEQTALLNQINAAKNRPELQDIWRAAKVDVREPILRFFQARMRSIEPQEAV